MTVGGGFNPRRGRLPSADWSPGAVSEPCRDVNPRHGRLPSADWSPGAVQIRRRDFNPRLGLAVVAGLGGGAVALAVLGVLFANRRVAVRGRSMAPLLENGELVLADRLAYWWRRPRRGDVALVRGRPGEGPELLLKRIVGLPGEMVTLARDRLLIDGQPLDLGRPVIGSGPGSWALGPDGYFLLSENLAVGTDSRHTGPVQRTDILGRAWLVYAPSVRRLPRSALVMGHRS